MTTTVGVRRIGVVVGGLALAAATLVGCNKAETTPNSFPTTSSFAPTVKATPAPTALPGNVITGN